MRHYQVVIARKNAFLIDECSNISVKLKEVHVIYLSIGELTHYFVMQRGFARQTLEVKLEKRVGCARRTRTFSKPQNPSISTLCNVFAHSLSEMKDDHYSVS